MLSITSHSFTDCHALAHALAGRVADKLREGLARRGKALLAVSGGSTPVHFFRQLARMELDWSKVQVVLVDERWVPESHERSNARMVKAELLQHAASAAHFVPFYADAPTPEAALVLVRARMAALPYPFDAVVLGMGGDGHTASFFPGGDRLAEALDLSGTALVLPMRAAGAGEPRITFTLPALLDTQALFLHIEGEAKQKILADARLGLGEARQYPVRAVLEQTRTPVSVYWCP
ncbi:MULTISPECIES: 6-phosphogluconolactonase [Dyella]|uniref:6-phosphogluconolactonase n=2 Tax=Dyella TaxID=231454 RepID=A0A4R0YRK0_9GAMM|nr:MULTISPECIES: 6-phosphogluconolactonase [Dyella]TBR35950.1 6-phosphogluconolactonase [Dyella terrae]TCI08503.1 6-phosphogluconolactonase [Dyella soli]